MKEIILKTFTEKFGSPGTAIFAPGRANIIGEHTDYNEGFVLPFAIGQGVWFYAKSNEKSHFTILAYDTNEEAVLTQDNSALKYGWEKYFRQVLTALSGYNITGADIVFGGDLSIGAGISSSSAITCGFVALLNQLNDLHLNADELVNKSVEAERGYGVRGGIMDQYSIFNGKKDKAILIDCRTNSHQYVDIEMGEHQFYLINTNVKHNLIHTDYNNRRAECEQAVSLLNQNYREINALRDLTISDLPKIRMMLDDLLFNRVSFVVQENRRVMQTIQALTDKNYAAVGELLYASHDGLAQMYQVSCEELDWLVNYTFDDEQFLGARMMGGGFGGCTINLTTGILDHNTVSDREKKYKDRFGIKPDIIRVHCENGILNKV
ncbi:MAG: galactokinase [Saprospiraceae bacterium]|nr:galactokinase [Saprospiraceae bacterium]